MRISHRWLTELLPGLTASPAEVAEKLTRGGLEVEAVEVFGVGNEHVRVAEVRKIEPHPKRDKLRLVTVSLGGGNEQRVVCGAANVPDPGGRVVLAPEGVTLPAIGLTLTPKAIGGVQSAGMLCSEVELGLADAADGILILEPEATPGSPLTEAVPEAQDTLFEIGVTPNRPDALGHVGVARDVAALFGVELVLPGAGTPQRARAEPLSRLVRVDNLDHERCPRYLAAMVRGVTIAPSPRWLRYRLQSLGVRPISNVVDVTNLALLEFGQPMHAFDFDRVEGGHVVVRRAKADEPFTTLDGVARKLDEDDLVICDDSGPTALAGIMGGENSEIRASTRDVLLECAYFAPRGIRRAGRRHGMHTESSHRFERGTDPAAVDHVLARARTLIADLAGGEAIEDVVEASGELPPRPVATLRSARLDAMLGAPVPFDEACTILGRLGFEVAREGTGQARVRCPSWRPDASMEADLVEEVARIRGLDAIPARLPAIAPQPPRTSGRLTRRVASEAARLGLSEAVCYAFVSPRDLEILGAPAPAVTLENPMSEERSVMRTSLLPGLLEALRQARRRSEREVRLFTVGSLFLPPTAAAPSPAAAAARPRLPSDPKALPEERLCFAAVLAGPRPGYLGNADDVDVYDAKGLCESLIEAIVGRTPRLALAATELPHLHPRGAARALVDDVPVGCLGPLHPTVVDALDLEGPAVVVELDLVALEALPIVRPRYRSIPRLPSVTRDVAVVVPETVPAGELQRAIASAAGDLCESVGLFDVFTGAGIPEGHRSLAYRVVYRDPRASTDPESARTLTDKEVEQLHERVRKAAAAIGALRT